MELDRQEMEAVFTGLAQEFYRAARPGERTLNEYSYFIMERHEDPSTIDPKIAWALAAHEAVFDGGLLGVLMRTGLDFDLSYPKYENMVDWRLPSMDSREHLSQIFDDNPFLGELALCRAETRPLVAGKLSYSERGNIYVLADTEDKQAYVAKGYQGEHEKRIGRMLSRSIGPGLYSAGEHSLVEELLADVKGFPAKGYFMLDALEPEQAGWCTAYLFSYMHSRNIIYDAWNWFEEVRVEKGKYPRIVDFGSALLWGEEERLLERHKNPLEELIQDDLAMIAPGLKRIFGRKGKRAVKAFEKHYPLMRTSLDSAASDY